MINFSNTYYLKKWVRAKKLYDMENIQVYTFFTLNPKYHTLTEYVSSNVSITG